ncbi:MAG: hypothetical protein OEM01_07870 [Desulfobulbaceae bacterium]|nr:hypothetical protein [Desulfobulbaceae bacterium]
MDINIRHEPPDNIPQIRWKYRRASLICLALVICSLTMGVLTVFYDTRYDNILEYTAFVLFVTSGFVFVYFTEKLMGYRRLGLRQKQELAALAKKNKEIEEYCRQVTAQGRYIVVNEYDAIVAYIEKAHSK